MNGGYQALLSNFQVPGNEAGTKDILQDIMHMIKLFLFQIPDLSPGSHSPYPWRPLLVNNTHSNLGSVRCEPCPWQLGMVARRYGQCDH